MTNPLTWVGRGASLLASGRAAQRASRGVDRTSQRDGREGRGAATREAWPVPVLSTVAAPAGADVEQLYRPALPPSRASLREAGRRRAELKQAEAEAPAAMKRRREEECVEREAELLAPLAAADAPRGKRRRSVLAAAVMHEAIPDGQAAVHEAKPVGAHGAKKCREVIQRWREFEAAMTEGDEVTRSNWRAGMSAGYPSTQLTLKFIKWLLVTRIYQSHSTRRDGREMIGRSANQVGQMATWMRNHVWPALFSSAGFPTGSAALAYWRPILQHLESLVGGGGGGAQQLAGVAMAAAQAVQTEAGADASTVELAGDAASRAAQLGVRAATASSTTREHLNQTGEYLLQDALLCEPFEVNESFVLNAYLGLARQTGCRPGMAVNVLQDSADPNGVWANCPPLIASDLLAGKFAEPLVLPETGCATLWYFETSFERVKGQYFATVRFGTALTPDSDATVRLGTVALCRLLLRTAAPRAVYAKLTGSEVVALRRKVDDPEGFAGLALEDTKYGTWGDLHARASPISPGEVCSVYWH